MSDRIKCIRGREILNANGKPTVEAELETENGICVTASVPSGTSRGKYEAYELYDGGSRFGGYGTRMAAGNISGELSDALKGHDVTDQKGIDRLMCSLDGTSDKRRLGGNAILAVSVAAARAGALAAELPLYRYLSQEKRKMKMPDIIATVISGGVFSGSGMEFEDYMYLLKDFDCFKDQLEALVTLHQSLEKNLRKKYGAFPEDGGALGAPCSSSEEAFKWMMDTAKEHGLEQHTELGLDVAASELFDEDKQIYRLQGGKVMHRRELMSYYESLCRAYPLTLIEDGFEQNDFESFARMREGLRGVQIVGDDLFATNYRRLQKGIEEKSGNGVLLKINQIGTVTEALETNDLARANGYDVLVSLRSGETNDDFIADLAVGIGARQIKLGSPVRQERNAKYNRLLKIADELNL